jgi:hypothetical protein
MEGEQRARLWTCREKASCRARRDERRSEGGGSGSEEQLCEKDKTKAKEQSRGVVCRGVDERVSGQASGVRHQASGSVGRYNVVGWDRMGQDGIGGRR